MLSRKCNMIDLFGLLSVLHECETNYILLKRLLQSRILVKRKASLHVLILSRQLFIITMPIIACLVPFRATTFASNFIQQCCVSALFFVMSIAGPLANIIRLCLCSEEGVCLQRGPHDAKLH